MAAARRSVHSPRGSVRSAFWLLILLFPSTIAVYYPPFLRKHPPCRLSTSRELNDPVDDEPLRLLQITAVRQAATTAKFSRGPILSSEDVSLSDGAASESLFFIFTPEEGKSINDYEFSFMSTNEKCLIHEDFTIGPMQSSNGAYNVTASIDFTRWVGVTDISITATDKNSSITVTSESVECTIVGMTFYREDANGTETIIGGPNNPLSLTTDEIVVNPNLDLNVFIQYPDGTNSSNSLNEKYPINGITITPSGVEQQITHNSSKCADTGNNFDGTTVTLSSGCAYGFAENSVDEKYFGPKFGLQFNKNENGNFNFLFDWPGLVAGSILESEGYQTYINVEISGEKTPILYPEDYGSLVILPTGGNAGDGKYYVGACGNTDFRAKLSYGALAQNPTYKWTLFDATANEDILAGSGIETNKEIIVLPYSIYPKKNTAYNLTLTVNTDVGKEVQQSYILVMRDTYGIGVRIIDPRPVSFSNPNITLTIPAIIGSPGCRYKDIEIDYPAITYIWVYRGVSYKFSYLNQTSPKDELGPTLLGREFQIPQYTMEYGTFPISLTAYYTNHTQIRGSDTSTVFVRPAPLIAKINAGESSQIFSDANDLEMTGSLSYDPDVLSGDNNADLRYQWTCMFSTDPQFVTNTTCGDELQPNASTRAFTVGKDSLSKIRTEGNETHLRYTLVVTKTSQNATGASIDRISNPFVSVITLPPVPDKKFDQLLDVQITNNQTILLDPGNVKYFEDVIITPVSKTTDTTWKFELIEPQSQASLIANSKNLIPYFGFYSIGQPVGRYSLGILSNKLKPDTKYVFKISSFRTGFERNEQTITLRTVKEPTVSISHMPMKNGTVGTTFYTSATTNYDGDFKYFFIVTDQFGYQYCVDGCQGVRVARFQLASAGSYSLRCEVYDSLGHTLLASSNSSVTLTVVPPSPPLTVAQLDNLADNAFLSGDHALYVQYTNDIVKNIVDRGNSSTAEPDLDSEIVMNLTRNLGQIVANSVPNPIQSATYVRTAASLAQLTPDHGITYDLEGLYNLVNVTQNAIARTPDNAALQQLEDLLQFYDLAPQLLSRIFVEKAATVIRTRQLDSVTENLHKKVIWADMYELMKEQITMILLKGAVCGAKQSVKTGKPSKSQAALALRHLTARQTATEDESNETVAPENSSDDTEVEEPSRNTPESSEDENDSEETNFGNMTMLTTPEPVSEQANDNGTRPDTGKGQNSTVEDVAMNTSRNPTQGKLQPSLFQVAKLCNPEQGLELKISEDTKDEVRFKSCPDVFRMSFRTLMFSVVSTPDYIWLSELQRVETRIQGLVSVSVAEHKIGNKLVEDDTRARNCFEVEMPLITSGALGELETKNGSTISGVRFAPKRVFGTLLEKLHGFYRPRVKDTTAKVISKRVTGRKDISARARLISSKTGIFAVTTSNYGDNLWGIHWTLIIVLGMVAIILLIVALVALSIHRLTSTREEAVPAPGMVAVDGDYTYVERDNFGRGDGFALLDPQYEVAEGAEDATAAAATTAPSEIVDEIEDTTR